MRTAHAHTAALALRTPLRAAASRGCPRNSGRSAPEDAVAPWPAPPRRAPSARRSLRPSLREVLPLLWASVATQAAADAGCTLASLILRCQDSPIDLEPAFEPYIDSYQAKLDWSFDAFSVDARPDTGCEVDGVPALPTDVPIGGSAKLMLYSRHPDTGDKRAYVVTAYRRLGSETELRSLDVVGGELSPVFSARHREYTVRLDLAHDVASIRYGLMDNEQRLTASAREEHPSGSGSGEEADGGGTQATGNASGAEAGDGASRRGGGEDADGGGGGRRLGGGAAGLAGEVQFRIARVDFMLDVGFSRTVTLTVQCADPTQASIGTYTLHISRPGCTLERPYFNPEKQVCVNFCSSGYYRNRQTHRCSKCNENCQICSGLLNCNMCKPDSADFNYAIQPDGKCRAIENHLFLKYRWWCAGLGVLLLFLVVIGCCGILQLCCSRPGGKSGRFSQLQDADSDEDLLLRPQYGGDGGGGGRSRFARY